MTKRLLDVTPDGIMEYFEYDDAAESMTITTVQNVEPILERNKAYQTDHDGMSPTREWKWIASIPNVVLMKWRAEEGIDWTNRNHWPAIVRKLRDPDYRFLRTGLGGI
jgi:hypothetical protein